jgi:hypothetical protein
MSKEKKPADLLRADMMVEFDLSDLGLGKHRIEYDPEKPAEAIEAEKRVARIESLLARGGVGPQQPVRATPMLSAVIADFLSDEEIRKRKNAPATVRRDADALKGRWRLA